MQPQAEKSIDNYNWLISDAARPWLNRRAEAQDSLTALTQQLRRDLSPQRTHLVLETLELRRRAKEKFKSAAALFFTDRGLQQATGQTISRYKASRFPPGVPVADLCCGIGGDMMSLAHARQIVGVDRDPIMCLLAETNCRALGHRQAKVVECEVAEFNIEPFAAWHIDPDRRPQGRRTTRVASHRPDANQIDQLRQRVADGAVKLAPAAGLPEQWVAESECEWIGSRRECKQLVVWFGQLGTNPPSVAATVLDEEGEPISTIVGRRNDPANVSRRPLRYVYDPHSAVIAARLVGTLANQHGLATLGQGSCYLTADVKVSDPALSTFYVTDVLPMDVKQLRSVLRERRIGSLEIKKRDVSVDPVIIRRQLRVPGDNRATVIVSRIEQRVVAIICQRTEEMYEAVDVNQSECSRLDS